jgi:hypothetical protein
VKKMKVAKVRGPIAIATFVLLCILLAGFAALGFCDIYRNHIAAECGAGCGRTPSEGDSRTITERQR